MNARSFNLTTAPKFNGQTFQIYTNNSVRDFMDMGYKYKHPNPTWESISQPTNLVQPRHNQPSYTPTFYLGWTPFDTIRAKKLKFLYQLLNVKMKRYHTYNPFIPPTQWKTATQLNKELSTDTAQAVITQPQWNILIEQIPPKMTNILLEGNQKFFEDEFLATMLRGGKMADIYLLSNGILTYYTRA